MAKYNQLTFLLFKGLTGSMNLYRNPVVFHHLVNSKTLVWIRLQQSFNQLLSCTNSQISPDKHFRKIIWRMFNGT